MPKVEHRSEGIDWQQCNQLPGPITALLQDSVAGAVAGVAIGARGGTKGVHTGFVVGGLTGILVGMVHGGHRIRAIEACEKERNGGFHNQADHDTSKIAKVADSDSRSLTTAQLADEAMSDDGRSKREKREYQVQLSKDLTKIGMLPKVELR